jgi:predicted DNA-binding transcriptional regulator AlpA
MVKLDLVGLAEVAEMLGTSRRQAIRWTQREDFPEPVLRLRATPVWEGREVRRWKRERAQQAEAGPMIEDDFSGGGGLQATMAVQFVERDGRIFVIFEAGLGPKLIHVGVAEVSPGLFEHTT